MLLTGCRLILLSSFALVMSQANAIKTDSTVKIPAFVAKYNILHKSDPIGSATRELIYLNDDKLSYRYQAKSQWLFLSDERDETSIITLDNDKVLPQNYRYKRKGTGRDKHYHWRYDQPNNLAINLEKDIKLAIDFKQPIQDKLSYHLQHRLNLINQPEQKTFTYPVISTSGKIKDYTYEYDGEETLHLPYGAIRTLKYKREQIEKKRITYAWFAPELDYLLVQLYQVKAGKKQFEVQLTTYTTNVEKK